jgi:hypothetical protein
MVHRTNSYLLVIGDCEALAWVLSSRQMAFSERGSMSAARLEPGDNLLLYTTRNCFGYPHRDPGRIIGHATVGHTVVTLKDPVVFDDRTYSVGCSLDLHRLTPFRQGVELADHVKSMHAFPNPRSWSVRLRRTLLALDAHDYSLLFRALRAIAVEPDNAVEGYVRQATSRRTQRARTGDG